MWVFLQVNVMSCLAELFDDHLRHGWTEFCSVQCNVTTLIQHLFKNCLNKSLSYFLIQIIFTFHTYHHCFDAEYLHNLKTLKSGFQMTLKI